MEMAAHEIVRSYKEAKDKKKQVSILAQLNLCTPEDIKKILVEGGINWRELPRGKRCLLYTSDAADDRRLG